MQVHAPQTALAHVLAVDDDPIIREAIADYLSQHEFRVTTVADGGEMRTVLARDVVDLVVLDLKLVTEDGMTLARRLRDESAIPIIMLTGRRRRLSDHTVQPA
jgi:two-component system, OmpR family, response regulator